MSTEFIGEGTPLEDIPSSSLEPSNESQLPEDFGEIKSYKKGDIITGVVVQVKDDAVLLDIQTKSEGILPKEEISFAPNPTTEGFEQGQEVEVMVVKEGEDIYTLSKRRVDEKKIWDRVAEAHKDNSRMKGKIIAAVNGGLIIDIGGRAFLPQSQIDLKRVEDLEAMIGQDIEVKVLEHDREKNRLVVSRRLCIEEDIEKQKLEAFDSIKKGTVLEGKVEKIVDYGIFVNLGNGITGLLHVSELSWERVDDPRSEVKIGDVIEVKVLKIDKDKKKISLSRKATLAEPWETVTDKYKKDQIVQGTITRVASFGCFIKLDDYFEGLAHISELVDQRINHAKEVFSPGDRVTVLILDVDKRRKRIRLSVRRAREKQTEREVQSFMKHQDELDNTLGSRFGDALSDLDLGAEEPKEEVSEPVDGDASDDTVEVESVEQSAGEPEIEEAAVEEEAPVEEVKAESVEEPKEETVEESKPEEPVVEEKDEEEVEEKSEDASEEDTEKKE